MVLSAFPNPLTAPLRQSICQGGHSSDARTPPPWREAPPRGSKRGDFLANLARRHFGLKLLIKQEMEEWWLHHRGYTEMLRYLVANNVLKLGDNPERVGAILATLPPEASRASARQNVVRDSSKW